jgi:hypothetical protein
MTSWNNRLPAPLLSGPVRAYEDHKADWIVIETTKDNPRGAGQVVCWVPMTGVGDARMITALPELLRNAVPFAALGRELAEDDAESPLISDPAAQLEIMVGDVQRIAAAVAKAFPPVDEAGAAQMQRGPRRRYRPG